MLIARRRLGHDELFRVDHQNQVILLSRGVEGRHAVEAFVAAQQQATLYVLDQDDVSAEVRAQLLASTERMLYDTHADGPIVEMLKRAGVDGFDESDEGWLTPRLGVLVGFLGAAVVGVGLFWWAQLAGWGSPPAPAQPPRAQLATALIDLEQGMERIDTALNLGPLEPVIDPRGPWVYHSKSEHGIIRSSVTGEGPVRVVFEADQRLTHMAISPDGSRLVALELGGRISVVNLRSQSFPVHVLEMPSATLAHLIDASTLVWADSSDAWHTVRVDGGESQVMSDVSSVVVASSRDGLVALVRKHGSSRFMEVRDLVSGTTHGTLTINSEQAPVAIDGTPDLRTIVVGLNDGTLVRYQRSAAGASVLSSTIDVDAGQLSLRSDTKGHSFMAAGDDLWIIDYDSLTPFARVPPDRMPRGAVLGLRWSLYPSAFSVVRRTGVTTWRL
ncbi:MAG: hypothetical protein AAF797_17595 [Planctomycetota bacterium]